MAVNATVFLSDDCGNGTRYEASTQTYEPTGERGRFVCTSLTIRKGSLAHAVYVGIVSIHAAKAADLDVLIAELSAARSWLDDAERADQRCDNCNAAGTEENPLVPVESCAAHPEGYVHGAGCPDAGPHHEDAHADSAPLG